jgi:cytochrome c oxidase assembly factor CtaG
MNLRRARRGRASLSCVLGLAAVALALVPPLAALAGTYLWVRALQILLLLLAGPGFLIAGASQLPIRLGTWPAALPARWPVAATVVANAAWLCWQLPVLVGLARTDAVVAVAEHLCYLAAGLLLWRQLLTAEVPVLRRIALLVASAGVFTVAGMVLVFGSGVLYPGYAAGAHHVMTLLDDQQLSGAVLWMGSLPSFIAAGMALVLQWLSSEEAAAAPGRRRRPAASRTGWPSGPVIR